MKSLLVLTIIILHLYNIECYIPTCKTGKDAEQESKQLYTIYRCPADKCKIYSDCLLKLGLDRCCSQGTCIYQSSLEPWMISGCPN